MTQSKYKIEINWSDEDGVYVARVPELSGVITHGKDIVEAVKMADEAIELHLESLAAYNEEIPEPASLQNLSGKFQLRMNKELHVNATIRQHELGLKSLNEYFNCLIEEDIQGDRPQGKVLQWHGKKLTPAEAKLKRRITKNPQMIKKSSSRQAPLKKKNKK